jgi:hypothetical protein
VEIEVNGVEPTLLRGRPEPRWLLDDDVDALAGARELLGAAGGVVHLLGPFDPYVQLRDRATLVPDPTAGKELWRTLGRPGALAASGEMLGTWRPRAAGSRLTVRVEPWAPLDAAVRGHVEEAGARLAAFRGVAFAGIEEG